MRSLNRCKTTDNFKSFKMTYREVRSSVFLRDTTFASVYGLSDVSCRVVSQGAKAAAPLTLTTRLHRTDATPTSGLRFPPGAGARMVTVVYPSTADASAVAVVSVAFWRLARPDGRFEEQTENQN